MLGFHAIASGALAAGGSGGGAAVQAAMLVCATLHSGDVATSAAVQMIESVLAASLLAAPAAHGVNFLSGISPTDVTLNDDDEGTASSLSPAIVSTCDV